MVHVLRKAIQHRWQSYSLGVVVVPFCTRWIDIFIHPFASLLPRCAHDVLFDRGNISARSKTLCRYDHAQRKLTNPTYNLPARSTGYNLDRSCAWTSSSDWYTMSLTKQEECYCLTDMYGVGCLAHQTPSPTDLSHRIIYYTVDLSFSCIRPEN